MVRGDGGDVGAMRRSEAEMMVELFELGDGADVEGEWKQSPVLYSSGGRRTSSGRWRRGLLDREMMSRRCGTKWRFG